MMIDVKKLFFVILVLQIFQFGFSQENKRKKIVIVGAGLAGISAAAKLIENGYTNIEILEALNRKGGRIWTIDYGTNGQKLDLGAQWIHGEGKNVIWEMVSKHVELGSTPFDSLDATYLFSNGSLPNQNDCLKLQKVIDKIVENSWGAAKKYSGSFGNFFLENYSKFLTKAAYKKIKQELKVMMQEDAEKQVAGFYGCPSWFELSARLNADYTDTKGDQDVTWGDKGFATVFDYITKKKPNAYEYLDVDSKIQFNKEVVEIQWSKVPTDRTTLKCADGSIYEADNVIVTVSLGVLKAQHETLFVPKLPIRKRVAIEKCGFGTIGKIFLKFIKPFWLFPDSDFMSYVFLWKDEDKQAIIGTDKEWLLGIMTFSKVDAYPNLLEAFYAGPLMSTFETISDQKLIDDCMWLLEKFLGKSLPAPSYMQRTKWLTDKTFLGAYSFISFASEEPAPDVTPADLAAPIEKQDGKNFLFFAGEATSINYPSYAHGAVESGYRAATEVIEAL